MGSFNAGEPERDAVFPILLTLDLVEESRLEGKDRKRKQ